MNTSMATNQLNHTSIMYTYNYQYLKKIAFVLFLFGKILAGHSQPAINGTITCTLRDNYTTNTSFWAEWSVSYSYSSSGIEYNDDWTHYYEILVYDNNGNSWTHFSQMRLYHVCDLDPNTNTFYYKVRGVNEATGPSDWSAPYTVSMNDDVDLVLGAPAEIFVSSILQTSFHLSWESLWNPTNDDGYPWIIDIATDPLFQETIDGYDGLSFVTDTYELTIDNLTPGETYYVRIEDGTNSETIYSMSKQVLMDPATPFVYEPRNVTATSFILYWEEQRGVENYEIYLNDDSGFAKTYTTTNTEYFFSGLPSGGIIEYSITAQNSSGNIKSELLEIDLLGGEGD